MSCHLHGLPEAVLDELVKYALDSSPSLRLTFLASLGSHLHVSAARVLFKTLKIADDQSATNHHSRSATRALFADPERYAVIVKTIIVCDSDMRNGHGQTTIKGSLQRVQHNTVVPADASTIYNLLEVCLNLEGLFWESAFPPPEGLCEVLMSRNLRLSRLAYAPRNQSLFSSRSNVAKWDALSLPLLMYLPITALHLSGLSQSGARAFSALLSNLGQGSTLEELNINFVWLDDSLCEKIAEAGWKLRRLHISTSGTKLSDKGLVSILEECEALEDLALVEVQGRLSRQLWAKPQHFPLSLRHLQIVVSETGPHHSWTTDHLHSLHAVPLEKLLSLSVIRHEAHPRLENGVLSFGHGTDDVLALNPVPTSFVEKMRDGGLLTTFECDFWMWSVADIKVVLNSCPNLQTIKISLDFAFSKLPSLTSIFVSMSDLRRLSVSVNPLHAPGTPPRLQHPLILNTIPTPAESPILKPKSVLPQLLDYDQMQTQTYVSKSTGDPSIPLLRDVKRFVRKCPRLTHLDWYGKAGRGSWVVARPTSSKLSVNISVEYKAPSVAHEVWRAIIQKHELDEQSARNHSWKNVKRIGHLWTGEAAETLAKEMGKDDFPPSPIEVPRKLKELTGREAKLEALSPSSSDSLSTPSLSEVSPSLSPVSSSFPLTPPHSERSFSDYNTIPKDSDPFLSEMSSERKLTANYKRSPSEPALRIAGSPKGRARSTTTSPGQDIRSERRESPAQLIPSTTSNNAAKYVRGKGRDAGRNRRHSNTPSDGAPARRCHKGSNLNRGRKPANVV